MFKKILVANRGEIAVRIVRACRDMGIAAVAVYEPDDMGALHVRLADEAHALPAQGDYRSPEAMLAVALRVGVDAVHPGYGIISEHPGFVRACEEAGVAVIGPGSAVLEQVRNKIDTLERVRAAGIPTTRPSSRSFAPDEGEAMLAEATRIGFPLVVKAHAGGHGRGTHVVYDSDTLLAVVKRSSGAAQAFYGDAHIYLEAAMPASRYIEVPVLGDCHGTIVHLGERDGSIQRNTRKVIGESPAPGIDQAQREAIWQTAIQVARLFGICGAATVEFVVDSAGQHHFTEIKPRIQVEHLATEMVTRIDTVREQLRIAAGEPLGYSQEQVRLSGVSIFCRINAEDPWHGYMPSPGQITCFRIPGGPNVRVDTYAYSGSEVPVHYDSLMAKLVVWGTSREECLHRVHRALQEFQINGVQTNLGLLRLIVNDEEFVSGSYTTDSSQRHLIDTPPSDDNLSDIAAVAALAFLARARSASPATPPAFTSGWYRESRRIP
ncbi:ATP-grasp domain-containing protein [Oscillochloris sp. ZM17-4]|uniref:acetyl-CoA carboxylase biotin carboxylase subunit n=1 Tax=Oscillochloris sp. ZM17-4 TaxID=2866714 RepID=UPI001C72B386|nr:biotin carboxylase N-terminal domain-containing protein [Oscillochloris sp. ZM17-4]MBX0330872.1 ATP-grasp domain-containing protein [Oscillochloris sp. ZM17-4]